ncbi:MAG TPA: hypothetical protein VFJ94_10070 [Intrasporangium sp.]|uniref:hypothetical protein n=1 Tax=Intrasporangium sp. TaxID=1925024 RepID=UPI002D781680|nr:hypothetical protein [Intrasporangium sp.]HET7398854.1 hypothetical protein [Intrasporangium sp.]
MHKRYALLLAAPAALMLSAGAATASSAGHFGADLRPVPHTPTADGGSNVTGTAKLRLTGRTLRVDIKAAGLTPNEPHAMHIHGVLQARNECPTIAADVNTGDSIDPATFVAGEPDGLISLSEGAPSYGPIDVSLTTSGDTSPSSGLALERFATADSEGRLDYHRTFAIPKGVAKDLADLHIVLHGTDLPSDSDHSSLSSLFEATLPVACGEISRER